MCNVMIDVFHGHFNAPAMHARYGLGEFLLISPDEGVESLMSQAQAKLMLSSISVALANTGWYVLHD